MRDPEPSEPLARFASPPTGRGRLVEVVVPVYNERRALASSVRHLHDYLTGTFPYGFRITIADNASTDGTGGIAEGLARDLPGVRAVRLDEKGRGRALRRVWAESDADVVCYMDVDLSTGLNAFLPLVAPLLSGHSDLAIGTRLARTSRVVRGPKREIISRAYNLLLRSAMGARFSDAQCGFKAARTEVVQALLPAVEDEQWFFDTELLLLAERHGLRIHEVPVDWVDDPDSRVDIVRTALDDLRGMARLARTALSDVPDAVRPEFPAGVRPGSPEGSRVVGPGLPEGSRVVGSGLPEDPRPGRAGLRPRPARPRLVRHLASFAAVGVACTLAYTALFWVLRGFMPAVAANAVALLVTAVANTAANRRFTFGVSGRAGALRHHVQGLVAFAAGLALTTCALALLPDTASRTAELAGVVCANALATLLRFLLLRAWVFTPRRPERGGPDRSRPLPADQKENGR
ncbi:glycosyltransferase [Sphaerisporangium album]|uniref:dolichyl-phosphate beta-glucosyltransferase n=1 Tax=Sphaerisporangium album TaxID=509200 RepID=A0A367FI99_9ACTN|nr:glycosyltransferase [Sphaerisporangium album]